MGVPAGGGFDAYASAARHAALAANLLGVPADIAITPAALRFYATPPASGDDIGSVEPLVQARVRVIDTRRDRRTDFRPPHGVLVTIDAEPAAAQFGDVSFDAGLAVPMLGGIISTMPHIARQKAFATALSELVDRAGVGEFTEYRDYCDGRHPERAKGDMPKVLGAGLTAAGYESLGGNLDDVKRLALRRWLSVRPHRSKSRFQGQSILTVAAAAGTLAAGCVLAKMAGDRVIRHISTASRDCGVSVTIEHSYQ